MRDHWTVADVMTSDVVTAGEDDSFKDLAALLSEHRVTAVPVVDPDGRVVGVVSVTDLLCKERFQMPWRSRRVRRDGRTPARAKAAATTARELMTAPAVTIGPDASLPAAARSLSRHRVSRLMVVGDDGRPLGVVSQSDLLRAFLTPDEELAEHVLRRLVHFALWDDPFAVHVEVRDGVAVLTGEVERRSLTVLATRLAGSVDGVVDVDDRLAYLLDDTDLPPD